MISYLSYFQSVPVRVIRNRRIRVSCGAGAVVLAVTFVLLFVALRGEQGGWLFVTCLLAAAVIFLGYLAYGWYRKVVSVPLQLAPCPYCGDFLGYEHLYNIFPIYDLSICPTCLHDFDTPFDPKDMRPGSLETP